MPIYELLKRQGSFGPDEIAVLGNVFEEVLGVLRLVDREDPITAAVARKLIDLAIAGIREPERLKNLTLQAFGEPSPPSEVWSSSPARVIPSNGFTRQ